MGSDAITRPVRETDTPLDFIRTIVAEDVSAGKHAGRVATRFPPEPNGYLHIGHAKSICLNFGVAAEFGGTCNLRFDDTNPTKEDVEYVESIQEDVRWLGFEWDGEPLYASDYFETLYGYAVHLIMAGKAYVDSLSAEEIREYRGTLTEPGRESPYRDRPVEENLDLFARMRAGEFEDGAHVLRAKIDMASPNINMRDPVLYRIRRAHHHRTGDAWCIYPMYDFAHPPSDAIEKITHSLCTLEFEDHRPLYDWLIANLPVPAQPRQIEFARLNLIVHGHEQAQAARRWSRRATSPAGTIRACRRSSACGAAAITPEAIRTFCERIGVAKRENLVDVALLEHAVREDLNKRAPRVMAVLRPLRVVIENYPEARPRSSRSVNNPEDPSAGHAARCRSRACSTSSATTSWRTRRRSSSGWRPAARCACAAPTSSPAREAVKDAAGEIVELRCTYDPATRGGDAADGRKVKATLHWVSAAHAARRRGAPLRSALQERDAGRRRRLPRRSEPRLARGRGRVQDRAVRGRGAAGTRYQFERLGYFCVDPDSRAGLPGLQPHRLAEGQLGQGGGRRSESLNARLGQTVQHTS